MLRAVSTLIATTVIVASAAGCRREGPVAEDSTRPARAPGRLSSAIEIESAYATARLQNDPDDPAIWVHPTDPSRSLIIATMKVPAPAGAIVVFSLDGQIRQVISGIDRPNKAGHLSDARDTARGCRDSRGIPPAVRRR